MSNSLKLPTNWSIYLAEIKDRCINLINYKIWNGIEVDKLNIWLKNFETDEERYLSACILDSLMYRSNSKTKALIYHLFNVVLPNFTRLNPTPIGVINDWFERLGNLNPDPGIRLVATIGDNDPPTKSTHHILRLLKTDHSVEESWIVHPNKLKYHHQSGIRTFIFIDDFMGSGEQFDEIVTEYNLTRLENSYILYAPLVAHEKGCNYLKTNYGDKIKVVSSEYISDDQNFFAHYFSEQADQARSVYSDLLTRKKFTFPNKRNAFGYGDLQIAYSFEHACPDNSLNVLWLKNNEWNPLFDR